MNTESLFDEAIAAARLSPNRVRHVGAVLQLADGRQLQACNTYPAGVRDLEERHAGNGRLVWMEHAERNAIFAAARAGWPTAGARLASTYFPCNECARAIVQAGIRELLTLPPVLDDPVWGPTFGPSMAILAEGGVRVRHLARDAAAVHASTMAPPDGD